MPKAKVPNVLIVENTTGSVFIVEKKGKLSEVDKIMRRAPKKESRPAEDNMIIEEYLDEEYLQQLENEMIIKEEFDDLGLNLESSESIKVNVVNKDHPYTTGLDKIGDQDPFQSFENSLDDEVVENIVVEEIYNSTDVDDPTKSIKKHHKSQQLTGKAACKYCETVFKSKEQLREHDCEYLKCDPKNFICRICFKELSRKTFSNHLHETLDCQYCKKEFLNPRNLKTHIRKLHSDQEFIPPPSPKAVQKDFELEEPIKYIDEETGLIVRNVPAKKERKRYPRKKGRYECDLCGRILTTERSLAQHFNLHSRIYKYICETCGAKFTTRTGIVKHACLNRQRKRPETDFRTSDVRTCKYCELSFASLEANKEHDCEFQYPDDPKMFRCRYCDYVMSKNSFNKHMARHLDTNEYVCNLCDKKLANESSLETHLSTHSGMKKYMCSECDRTFISKVLLIRHSRFHGNQIPIHQCDICNKSVASKYHLKAHIASMHSDVHECKICKEGFPSRKELKDHYTASHEPYACSVCNKSFLLERYLKMHEKLHKNVSTQYFRCPYCQRKFSRRSIADHVYKMHAENFDIWRDNNLELI